MIRVLNVITDTNIGGAGKVLLNFLGKTDRAEFDHTVIVPENAELASRLRALDIPVVEMPGIADKSLSPGAVGAFKREFSRLKPDVIHTHASLSARIAARRWNIKCAIVHTRHSAFPQGKLKTTFPLKQMLGWVNNRFSDVIIAVSPAAADNLTDTGTNPGKIVTVFNGVEPVRLLTGEEKAAVKKALGIKSGQFVCAIIARLVPEKGHEFVLEAVEMLADLPIRFIIAGAGPIESQLRATADAKGLDNCIFTGFIDDIARIENIMDLQINASYGTEASSLSLIEGMSLGVPAVVSDYGGNPYIITDGETGIIFPSRNSTALAGAIRNLHRDPEALAQMGVSALETYNTRFTAAAMAAGIEQVYRSALRKAGNA